MVRNKLRWNANNAGVFSKHRKVGWAGKSFFVLEVPLRYLRPSLIYSLPCDRILQRAIILSSRSHACDFLITKEWNFRNILVSLTWISLSLLVEYDLTLSLSG